MDKLPTSRREYENFAINYVDGVLDLVKYLLSSSQGGFRFVESSKSRVFPMLADLRRELQRSAVSFSTSDRQNEISAIANRYRPQTSN
ncbi:MAG: hypothetical protein CPDRYMAC_4484 [uncultured Paraburkholderia sp.]|nr:MAG: hypothetical protein CPDRYDRY_4348 [uncultured Paraburkholderia sp.]CAH2936899.1 MAG: hypothetical protein CPDRYMAC_4484 [uncultured Paraburkholderia sp.]